VDSTENILLGSMIDSSGDFLADNLATLSHSKRDPLAAAGVDLENNYEVKGMQLLNN
jgi:hypothetical protein